ncbi:uncharacterized protein LOC107424195 isoform X1 [Ziziphus jujuba]|uniref:Uncharacterized protein LOC107424195 isoform X1 n=1 Tax=Ziziphus jujuba TaxID=326968 RepID=A0A6P6GE53_ZIZJJ|nr:uncharacterized protein LOC107424195 isoform X1 [Ziziphus jujuba]
MMTRSPTNFTSISKTEKTALIEPTKNSMTMSESGGNGSSSSARTLKNSKPKIGRPCNSSSGCRPAWSMSPLMEVLPESPSPICSSCSSLLSSASCSPQSQRFVFSQLPPEFSASRNQSLCTLPNRSKQSTPHIQVNDWMEHAQQQLGHLQNYPQDCGFKCYLGSSSTCENEFVGLPIPTEKEECGSVRDYSHQGCAQSMNEPSEAGSADAQQSKLMTRPKPYHAFLDEVKKKELEAEIDSWRKAKQMELMDKLTRKEAAINEWELKQASKVMEEMKKLEIKLEKRRAKMSEKTQKKISKAKAEANKKIAKARRATNDKISEVSKVSSRARTTRNLTWIKLLRFF